MDVIDIMIADLLQCLKRLTAENFPRNHDSMINTLAYIESLTGDLIRIVREERLQNAFER